MAVARACEVAVATAAVPVAMGVFVASPEGSSSPPEQAIPMMNVKDRAASSSKTCAFRTTINALCPKTVPPRFPVFWQPVYLPENVPGVT